MSYAPYYSSEGKLLGANTPTQSIPKDSRDWQSFLAWYAEQDPAPFTLDDVEPDPPTQEEQNETTIRSQITSEIDVIETEAVALQAILDDWATRTPSQAEVLAHVKRLTRNQIRLAVDVAKLGRLTVRKLDSAGG